ncbi:MAG: MFS transporter [Caulobacteraceae bacterium]|nr:MFS transporter [Caulobacteraceae bacterium]
MTTATPASGQEGIVGLGLLVAPGVSAAASFALLPLVLGALGPALGLSDAALGLIASTELGGLALGTVLGALALRRASRKQVTLWTLAALVAANLLSMAVSAASMLFVARGLAGVAAGGALAACYGGLSRTARAERNFAIFTLAQLLFGAAGLELLPTLFSRFDWRAAYGLLTLVGLIGAAAAMAEPRERPAGEGGAEAGARRRLTQILLDRSALLALGGVGAYFAAVGAVWTYAERIGVSGGLDAKAVASILAASQVVAIGGALTASVAAGRAPVRLGLLLGSLATAAGMAALIFHPGLVAYALAVCVITFAWNYVTAPQFAAAARVDADGTVAALLSTVTGLGVAGGPALAAGLVGRGFGPMLAVAALLSLGSLALLWPIAGDRAAAAKAQLVAPDAARETSVGLVP